MNKNVHISTKGFLILLLFLMQVELTAQTKNEIYGTVHAQNTKTPIPFATVIAYNIVDSSQIAGVMTDIKGEFQLPLKANAGAYLKVEHMSYQSKMYPLDKMNQSPLHLELENKNIDMKELVVVGKRPIVKSDNEHPTFLVNKRMKQASQTSLDILTQLPGIQTDIMQNITYNGNSNVQVYVNGRKRDKQFLKQIAPGRIDRIEIIEQPGSEYEGGSNLVINVLLKKAGNGFKGNIYTDIPTSSDMVFMFPGYNLLFGKEKFSIYTSYNGEISRFNISNNHSTSTDGSDYLSEQNVIQDNWSHQFNYGTDIYFDEHNTLSYQGFYNIYSNEHDGSIQITSPENIIYKAGKDDTDKNQRVFNSLFFQHQLNKQTSISADFSMYHFNAQNKTSYKFDSTQAFEVYNSNVAPHQNKYILKTDIKTQASEKWKIKTGIRYDFKKLEDKTRPVFEYQSQLYAFYADAGYQHKKWNIQLGIRSEMEQIKENASVENQFILLPSTAINYQFTPKQKGKLTYRRSIERPGVYQLNQGFQTIDPFATAIGNPNLHHSISNHYALEYAITPGQNYISLKSYLLQIKDFIDRLKYVGEAGTIISQTENLGRFQKSGIQLSSSLRLGQGINFQSLVDIYRQKAIPNRIGEANGLKERNLPGYTISASANVKLPLKIVGSIRYSYQSPQLRIQTKYYSDALYFISLQRQFNQLKVGVKTAIPFSEKFNYYGTSGSTDNLAYESEGNILLQQIPLFFNISYRFDKGSEVNKSKREKIGIEKRQKKGF